MPRPPPKPRVRPWKTIIAAAIVVLLVGGCLFGYSQFRSVRKELLGYCRVKLNDSRSEVTYRLGRAPMVLGASDGAGFMRFQPAYYTDPAADPKNIMPSGKSAGDFADWEYPVDPDSPKGPYVVVHFGEDQRVATVMCTDLTFGALNTCASVGGVNIGDSEEDMVSKLGAPSRSSIDGVTKKADYADIGLSVFLTRGKVFSLALTRSSYSSVELFLNYMNRTYLGRFERS